jgi:hypothetical protein
MLSTAGTTIHKINEALYGEKSETKHTTVASVPAQEETAETMFTVAYQTGYVEQELSRLGSALTATVCQLEDINGDVIVQGIAANIDLISAKLFELQKKLSDASALLSGSVNETTLSKKGGTQCKVKSKTNSTDYPLEMTMPGGAKITMEDLVFKLAILKSVLHRHLDEVTCGVIREPLGYPEIHGLYDIASSAYYALAATLYAEEITKDENYI